MSSYYERELANEEAAHLATENAAQAAYGRLTKKLEEVTAERDRAQKFIERVRAAAQKAKDTDNRWDVQDLIDTALEDAD